MSLKSNPVLKKNVSYRKQPFLKIKLSFCLEADYSGGQDTSSKPNGLLKANASDWNIQNALWPWLINKQK